MELKINPGYKHLVQKEDFCGAACIQMALFRKGVFIDQEELAKDLGIRIARKHRNLYIKKFRQLPNNHGHLGINLDDFKSNKMKKILRKYGLVCDIAYLNKIDNHREFIIENIRKNNDIMTNIYLKPIRNVDTGHYVLISEFDNRNDVVTICDPSFSSKSFWNITLEDLLNSMSYKWTGKYRGFLVLRGV